MKKYKGKRNGRWRAVQRKWRIPCELESQYYIVAEGWKELYYVSEEENVSEDTFCGEDTEGEDGLVVNEEEEILKNRKRREYSTWRKMKWKSYGWRLMMS